MAQTKSRQTAEPVTAEQMPWTRCDRCGRQVFYRKRTKGGASAALTEHYNSSPDHVGEPVSA